MSAIEYGTYIETCKHVMNTERIVNTTVIDTNRLISFRRIY